VEDIIWDDNAFASLVLPGDYKKLILSFAQGQIMVRNVFDDVITGKGQI